MKKIINLILICFLISFLSGCCCLQKDNDVLYQTSTINALMEGVFDGETNFSDLKKHGDFAIGTFNALDGEMIGLDGDFFRIRADGKAYSVKSAEKTPFAVATKFDSDANYMIYNIATLEDLTKYLDEKIPSQNIFYAIKIEGAFNYIKTRSAPMQNKPYPRLKDALKNQPEFEFNNIEGTIIGFRCPEFVNGINVPGYHFHFLTKDKSAGGHLLKCDIKDATVDVDYTSKFFLVLPEGESFFKKDLTDNKQKELEEIEK